ncbi:probable disease resistance protein RF9 isoform X2 [Quercus lobata]|uniref:probable disease resistance protein RF9 isoform X2 n=1 Tax=Quercus lobata TaxID=97700 RepID=UPI0012481673|nr:probable disease resistance protein RF9 isoform X2 [Quercus lobata]
MQAGGSSSSNEREREQRQTFSHLEDHVVGFDVDLKKLVDFLVEGGEDKRVTSICGTGGLGKTTLAKMVYNHPEVNKYFHYCAWVCISQRPVWEEIMNNLSQSLKVQINGWSDAELVRELRQAQEKNKCLIVLDDIWKIEDWNILHEVFPKKSKILLTSRNRDVALHVDPRGFHLELRCLNPESSWKLFEKLAISWRSDSVTKTIMEKLGKEVIQYCGGLPLAITILGSLLATKQTQDEWEEVHKHVKPYLYEEQNLLINKVLALSYNDLPSHLKPCFLYLGNFPKDLGISTKILIRMWMGEGFISKIQHGGGREDTMDDVGHRYLRELVQRSMVLVGKKTSLGRIKTCQMHDLMRDFCISKAEEENFLHFTDTLSMKQHKEQIGKVRRLAIVSESGDNSIKGIKFNKYPYLRSLLYFQPQHDESYFKESCFKKFKLVRVLHLEYFKNHQRKLPKDIGFLIHLRYLSLKDSNVTKVPSSVGNLRCLETLDLRINFSPSYCCILLDYIYPHTNLLDSLSKPRVPNVFKYMKQLKHLYLPRDYSVCGMLELGNLCYLQTLVNVQPKTIKIPTWFKLNCLRVLKVRTNKEAQDAIQMLISRSRCPYMEKLNLYYPVKKLPKAHQFSPNLAKLTLSETNLEEDPMATLEKLPNLKILRLFSSAFEGKNMVCSKSGFSQLQSIVLSSLLNLEEWRVEEGAMPSLSHLEIKDCNLKKWRVEKGAVPTINHLEITVYNLEEWKVEEGAMPSLSHLKIKNCILKEWMVEKGAMTCLSNLEIKDCSLKEWRVEKGAMNSLSNLVIKGCIREGWKVEEGAMTNLNNLVITDCILKEWRVEKEAMTNLNDLVIRNCTLEGWKVEEGAMTNLNNLVIHDCTLKEWTVEKGAMTMTNLSNLVIRNCTLEGWKVEEGAMTNLNNLEIHDCTLKEWTVEKGAMTMTNLSNLVIRNCTLEGWKVEEGAMNNLNNLVIHDCNLKEWRVEKGAMTMTNLSNLVIRNCTLEGWKVEEGAMNNLNNLEIHDCTLKEWRVEKGAMTMTDLSNLVIRNCTLEGWKVEEGAMTNLNNLVINDCTLKEWRVEKGAMTMIDLSNLVIRNCTMIDCKVEGGAMPSSDH